MQLAVLPIITSVQRLQQTGLKVNLKKSKLIFTELDYLGYVMGKGMRCLKAQQRKVATLAPPTPKTKKQLHYFLNLAGYYRHFIPHVVTVETLLTDQL